MGVYIYVLRERSVGGGAAELEETFLLFVTEGRQSVPPTQTLTNCSGSRRHFHDHKVQSTLGARPYCACARALSALYPIGHVASKFALLHVSLYVCNANNLIGPAHENF